MSQSRVFEKINIGMSEDGAAEILFQADVSCGISRHSSRTCDFSDFWRHYHITVDPTTRKVDSLSYVRKKRKSILQRLFRTKRVKKELSMRRRSRLRLRTCSARAHRCQRRGLIPVIPLMSDLQRIAETIETPRRHRNLSQVIYVQVIMGEVQDSSIVARNIGNRIPPSPPYFQLVTKSAIRAAIR